MTRYRPATVDPFAVQAREAARERRRTRAANAPTRTQTYQAVRKIGEGSEGVAAAAAAAEAAAVSASQAAASAAGLAPRVQAIEDDYIRSSDVATAASVGLVRPDGETIHVSDDGTISVADLEGAVSAAVDARLRELGVIS